MGPLNPNAPPYTPIAAAVTQSSDCCCFSQINNNSNHHFNFYRFPNPPLLPLMIPPPPAFYHHIYDLSNANLKLAHITNPNPRHAPNGYTPTNICAASDFTHDTGLHASNYTKEENSGEEVVKQVILLKKGMEGAAEAKAVAAATTAETTDERLATTGSTSVKKYSWKPKGCRYQCWNQNRKLLNVGITTSWKPKGCRHDFRYNAADGDGDGRTTVMIKNIPNRFDKKKMLESLDEHCRKINQKLLEQVDCHEGDHDAIFIPSEFDFLYLPMDFKTSQNLGYAFVNFTTPIGARRLSRELHYKSWADHGSRKVCVVTYARIQGLASLIGHLNKSSFCCETKEYLPVHFTPSRNGRSVTVSQHYIGKYIPTPKQT